MDGLVRIGTVVDVDPSTKSVRVYYPDTGLTSGWLRVLQHAGTSVCGLDGETPFLGVWLPKINTVVVTLYLPVPDGDGFVVGGI